MSLVGVYKLSKVLVPAENPGPDEKAFRYIPVEDYVATLTDPDEIRMFERDRQTVLIVTADEKVLMGIKIPEDVPADEIKKAEEMGRIRDGYVIIDTPEVKFEDGEIYLHDKLKMYTGEEWVQITTKNEGEINLIAQVFQKD